MYYKVYKITRKMIFSNFSNIFFGTFTNGKDFFSYKINFFKQIPKLVALFETKKRKKKIDTFFLSR